MNKSQENAIKKIERSLNEGIMQSDRDLYGAQVTVFDVKTRPIVDSNKLFISVNAEVEFTKLGSDNLLRALSHDSYLFFIGDRGAIKVAYSPTKR